MNTQNYASLEASKRLVDAGIVLKTEAYWIRVANSPMMLVDNRHGADEYYPAPSMAEVWRELSEQHDDEYLRLFKDEGKTFCGYGEYADRWGNENPTDALIDLLIWKEKP
jgi:hypothetical protein